MRNILLFPMYIPIPVALADREKSKIAPLSLGRIGQDAQRTGICGKQGFCFPALERGGIRLADVMLAHESFLQLPMYGHDDMLTGFLVVLASDGNYVWQEKQIKWLQQICVGLNPYLMKNQFLARTDYLLNFDPLTRLPFLSHFKQEAQQILEESSETHYAVTYLDIYNFKFINDTYGFTVGDDILRQIEI